jgi:hypothetical protein
LWNAGPPRCAAIVRFCARSPTTAPLRVRINQYTEAADYWRRYRAELSTAKHSEDRRKSSTPSVERIVRCEPQSLAQGFNTTSGRPCSSSRFGRTVDNAALVYLTRVLLARPAKPHLPFNGRPLAPITIPSAASQLRSRISPPRAFADLVERSLGAFSRRCARSIQSATLL